MTAVLLDLAHACRCGCTERLLGEERRDAPLLVLCAAAGGASPAAEAALGSWGAGGGRVLAEWRATAACAYRLKRAADEAGALSLRVLTSARGRARLQAYRRALFTPLYDFTYRLGCCGGGPQEADADEAEADADAAVAAMLRALPPVGGAVRLLTSALIPGCFGHGFSTRGGGVSRAPTLSSLNLVSSPRRRDSPALVGENRRRLALGAGFYPRPLHVLKVEHSAGVWVLGSAEPERYDAAVTDRAGPVLAAPGADCIPVLFADPVARAVGVAHAGWRGTLLGVAAATVSAMTERLGCRRADILVVLGPSVGPCCFTLEPEQAGRFRPACVRRRPGRRPNVDLRLANRLQLEEAGIPAHHIADDPGVAPCTSCHPQDFFSHVRDGAHFGTQLGFVWIKDRAASGDFPGTPPVL